jgi:hypothetical protein
LLLAPSSLLLRQRLHRRNVLLEQLFLQIDRRRGHNHSIAVRDRVASGGDQVRELLPGACSRFDQNAPLLTKRRYILRPIVASVNGLLTQMPQPFGWIRR